MSRIDKEFFEDFYKFDKKDDKINFDFKKDLFENSNLNEKKKENENKELYLSSKKEDEMDSLLNKNNYLNVFLESELNLEVINQNNEMDVENNETNKKDGESIKLKKIANLYKNKDLIYEFGIYHPLKNNKTQAILIKGSSYLHELKDKIYCVLDEIQNSENNQSSFFFIENCFFNDLRNPNNKILSSKILENKIRKLNNYTSYGTTYYNNLSSNNFNSSNQNININSNVNFSSNKNSTNEYKYKNTNEDYNSYSINNEKNPFYYSNMNNNPQNIYNLNEDLKFPYYNKELYSIPFYFSNEIYDEVSMGEKKINEINFRIGYPYLFRHIDHCDHMIMLTDIRYLDKCDRFDDENKCFVTFQKKLKRRICDACSFYYAKFISINDKITPDYKVLFYCESCLRKIHASEFIDPNIPNTLKLIPYFHD